MTFIITLIVLVVERFFHWSQLRRWNWLSLYELKLSTLRWTKGSSSVALALSVIPLLVAVGLINYLLDGLFYGIFKLVFSVLVLLYCIGPANLWVQTFQCLSDLHKEDPKIVAGHAKAAFGIAESLTIQAFHRALTSAIFIEANQRIFAVIFWFIVFGPLGAVLYRSISLSAQRSTLGTMQVATRVQGCLDWLPVRILALLFALSGHFTDVISLWTKNIKYGIEANNKFLTQCGIAALDIRKKDQLPEDGAAEKAALDLLDRAFLMFLVILAVVILIVR